MSSTPEQKVARLDQIMDAVHASLRQEIRNGGTVGMSVEDGYDESPGENGFVKCSPNGTRTYVIKVNGGAMWGRI